VLTATSVLPLVIGGTLILLPLIPVAIKLRESNHLNEELTVHLASLKKYEKLINEMRNYDQDDPDLRSELQPLEEAALAFRKLTGILERFDQRNNLIVAVLVNALYWAEIRNVRDLNAWRNEYGNRVEGWLRHIGRVEMLVSMGTWAAHLPKEHIWPQWSATLTFVADDLKHPLMYSESAIGNPVELGEGTQIRIITGANMAGKSTYLRTVGINYVLAHAGLPLLASRAQFSDVKLLTSMRTTDSLQDDTSYFLAELKRLSFIIDELHKGDRTLILLDEILKGTNSNDKAAGSRAFIEQLVHKPVSVLVATHDLSLCDLEADHPQVIRNQHFAAMIQGGDLSFSFEIQPGICDTMNATFLMKKLGIIPHTSRN
jgi:DNA mismatch repair ATPase MutS